MIDLLVFLFYFVLSFLITVKLADFLGLVSQQEVSRVFLGPVYGLSYALLGHGPFLFRSYICRFNLWIAPKIYPCRMSTTNRKSNLCELCAGRGGWASCAKSRSPEMLEMGREIFRKAA